jgi:hypothetical protein
MFRVGVRINLDQLVSRVLKSLSGDYGCEQDVLGFCGVVLHCTGWCSVRRGIGGVVLHT